jgi:hypothetical protein
LEDLNPEDKERYYNNYNNLSKATTSIDDFREINKKAEQQIVELENMLNNKNYVDNNLLTDHTGISSNTR